MAIPTITSITPMRGLTTGQTLLTIFGTHMRLPPVPPISGPPLEYTFPTIDILIGGKKANRIAVRNDPENGPDGTIASCLTPPHEPGPADIVLKNIDEDGAPVPGEIASLRQAFTYSRIDLTAESHLTRLVRTLLQMLKAQVMENVNLTVSTDFDDTLGTPLHMTAVSKLPSLVLVGPETKENRFYSLNELPVEGGGQAAGLPYYQRQVPYTLDLTFTLVGMSDHTIELFNLMHQCTMFFHKNKVLQMDRDPENDSAGQVMYEMDFSSHGQFKVQSEPNESNVRHFTGSFVIRGVDIDDALGIPLFEGRTTEPVTLTSEQTGSTGPL